MLILVIYYYCIIYYNKTYVYLRMYDVFFSYLQGEMFK